MLKGGRMTALLAFVMLRVKFVAMASGPPPIGVDLRSRDRMLSRNVGELIFGYFALMFRGLSISPISGLVVDRL